jgi:TetR/AcrR family transcriptional regulator, mexJK operon transcriptional repressor
MIATRTGRRASSKHESVFRAAKAVFISQGYEGTSMDDVARVAGTTKATVYAHAGSKEELFRLVVEEAVALSEEKIEPVRDDLQEAEALRLHLARFVEIACWAGSVGLQRTIIGTLAIFPEYGPLIEERVVSRVRSEMARWLDARGVEDADRAAQRLMDAATAARRFRTLYGVEPPLPAAPVKGQIQPGAMDDAIAAAVRAFLALQGWEQSGRRP